MIKIFVPVYNEGDRIAENLKYMYLKIKSILSEPFQIYVIDDGSTDKTSSVLCDMAADVDFKYYWYDGPSRRENVAKAMLELGKPDDIIILLDSDRSTDETVIPFAVQYIGKFDVVIGNRYMPGSIAKRTFKRETISRLYNFIVGLLFDTSLDDHECGFKVFKYSAIERVVPKMGFRPERKFFWDAEFLIRAYYMGLKIKEVPVNWTEGSRSAQSFWKDKSMIWYIIKNLRTLP